MRRKAIGMWLLFFTLFFGATVITVHSEQGGQVTLDHGGIYVTGEGATYILLRVVGPNGEMVCDISSSGEPLSWAVTIGLPDGRYSYEVRQGSVPKRIRGEENAGGSSGLKNHTWIDSGSFYVERGVIVLGVEGETGIIEEMPSQLKSLLTGIINFLVKPVYADVLHNDDVIITGSECIGFDCVNGESFGYNTVKLKENNLRISFEDTSVGSFPTNDWQIAINDTTSGGASYFTIWDLERGRRPFTIEAGAPAHSLYVEDFGRVGLGTSLPYTELHIADGDTPTVRLDQDGSSGWTAQSWDVAGNETNFFIRDVTNGSKLPFRIEPGSASSTLSLKKSGNVGIGTWVPTHTLHVMGDALITGNLELGSSRSLKGNIQSLNIMDASTTLAALQPVRFNYKTSPKEESLGFIAEDVPELVATESRKSISTMDIVAVLTKVVQDQQDTISKLEQKITELEKFVSNQQ